MKSAIRFLFVLLLIFTLSACRQNTSAYMQDPIALSGDTAYYAAMDYDLRKAALEMKHIALSGTASAGGYTTLFVGDAQQDKICFSCTFSERNGEIAVFKAGDTIQLHGVCTGIVDHLIYLEHCQLTAAVPPAQSNSSVPPTVSHTHPSSAPPTTPPTTESTVPPTTEPTITPTATESTDGLVWIPQSGKKYHITPSCSGMKNPSQVTKQEAEHNGFAPCKRCYS